jgi:hypothetical protein
MASKQQIVLLSHGTSVREMDAYDAYAKLVSVARLHLG